MSEHEPKWAEDEPPPHPLFLTDITRNVVCLQMLLSFKIGNFCEHTRSSVINLVFYKHNIDLESWLRTMTKETRLGGEYYTHKTGEPLV
jgi:hypothetical protein